LRIAFSVGDALTQARAQVAPGQWAIWLKANCFLSRRSAELYVQLAHHRDALEERMAEVPTLSLRAAARWIAKPKTTPKKAPQPKPLLQETWNKATPSERSAVLGRMSLNDLLDALPPPMRCRFEVTSWKPDLPRKAPQGAPDLRASETLRHAISLARSGNQFETTEAMAALRALDRMFAGEIDEFTLIRKRTKAKRMRAA
jgi:hypothetical protein